MKKTISDEPTYMQIVNLIKSRIESHWYQPGEAMESVRKFAAENNYSASTVHRAFNELEKQRYIETIPGKGSYIADHGVVEQVKKPKWSAFLSYSHKDNELTDGRIHQLALAIKKEYEATTGESLELFIDKDIDWGEDWRLRIDKQLEKTAFFIPVLTPNYLNSVECLKELRTVQSRAEALGRNKLVYPIIYKDIGKQLKQIPDDKLVNYLTSIQNRDYSELDYLDSSSSEYRKAVREISRNLVEYGQEPQNEVASPIPDNVDSFEHEDEPGIFDRYLEMEEAFDLIIEIMAGIHSSLNELSTIADDGTKGIADSDRRREGFKGRAIHIKRMSMGLSRVSETLFNQSKEFSKQFAKIDQGMQTLIPQASSEAEGSAENLSRYEEFHQQIADFYREAIVAFDQVQGLADSLEAGMDVSRDLRKPLLKIRQSLVGFTSNRAVIEDWNSLLKQYDPAFINH